MTYIMKKKTKKMWQNIFVIVTQFVIFKKLKIVTDMLCLWIPCHNLYKAVVFSYVLMFKYMCHFGMSSKNLNLKNKT